MPGLSYANSPRRCQKFSTVVLSHFGKLRDYPEFIEGTVSEFVEVAQGKLRD